MDMLIGPLIERSGKFAYDTFTVAEGLKGSFCYRCVSEARYDQRAVAAQAERDPRRNLRICETLAEFERSVAATRAGSEHAGYEIAGAMAMAD